MCYAENPHTSEAFIKPFRYFLDIIRGFEGGQIIIWNLCGYLS